MFWYVLLGFFAAVGVLSLLWLCAGLFLPDEKKQPVAICCPQNGTLTLLRRYRWLRELGLVRCPIVLLDSDLSLQEQKTLAQHYPCISFSTTQRWKQERM